MSSQPYHPLPLSVSEAARLFGLSEKTVRRAIKDRELPVMLIKGRYRMQFKDVLDWSSGRPRLTYARDTRGIGQFIAVWEGSKPVPESLMSPENSQQKGQLRLIP